MERSSVVRWEFDVEPLLLHVRRSQLRRFEHLVGMCPGRLPFGVLPGPPKGRDPSAGPELGAGIP